MVMRISNVTIASFFIYSAFRGSKNVKVIEVLKLKKLWYK